MSLYENINRRKKLGISRPKSKSTISDKQYSLMRQGFPKKKKRKMLKEHKNPKGGLTAKGREHFKRTEGANLKLKVVLIQTR